jgi:hypothetical protein
MQVGRFAVLAAAVLALAGCDGPTQEASHPVSAGMQRAAEVAKAWPGSAEEHIWRSGYYPLDVPKEWLPKDAFHSGEDKVAYADGRLKLETELPPAGPEAQVEWDGGARLSLPPVSAEAVLRAMTKYTPACTGHCAQLSVTAVRPGVRAVRTSRGQARIPVWEFTVAGYSDPFVYPAVAGQQPVRPVSPTSGEPVVPGAAGVVLRSVSADGLTLTGMVAVGGCYQVLPGEVYETDQVVVLIGHSRLTQPPGTPCPANAVGLPADFRLSRPLGDRVVLKLTTGAPEALPPGSEAADGDHGGQ